MTIRSAGFGNGAGFGVTTTGAGVGCGVKRLHPHSNNARTNRVLDAFNSKRQVFPGSAIVFSGVNAMPDVVSLVVLMIWVRRVIIIGDLI